MNLLVRRRRFIAEPLPALAPQAETVSPTSQADGTALPAAEVVVSTRRIVVRLSSSWPHLDWYRRVCERLRIPLPIPLPYPSG